MFDRAFCSLTLKLMNNDNELSSCVCGRLL